MTKPKAKPVEAEEAPPKDDRPPPKWRDPGRRISQTRIDPVIERIFNNGPRLGAPALAATEAA
jgi:hypothetical protein